MSEFGGDRPRVRSLQSLHVRQGHHRRIAMADSPNVADVRRLYQARGNPEVIRQVLGREVRWEVVDGFPHGAVYEGLDSVLRDFLVASSQTLTNSSRTAPSSLSQATM